MHACRSTLEDPTLVVNRPGLSSIDYRIGTHGRFKRELLDRIASDPALRGLTTRTDDDFAIALLDAWSCAADLTTFYQERLANESYLRTATERESLAQLARLLGYELGPGVAASAALSFIVDPIGARGRPVVLDVGTRVQSIPGPGEVPIVYETDEPLQARAEHNELRPARAGHELPGGIIDLDAPVNVVIRSRASNLVFERKGETVILATPPDAGPTPAQRWRVIPTANDEFLLQSPADGGLLTFVGSGSDLRVTPAQNLPTQRWTRTAQRNGGFQIATAGGGERIRPRDGTPPRPVAEPIDAIELPRVLWNFEPAALPVRVLTRTRVAPGDILLAVADADPTAARLVPVDSVIPRPDLDAIELVLSRFSGPSTAGPERLHVFRQRAGFFGHNAPDANILDFADGALFDGNPPDRDWKNFAVDDGPIDLDNVYPNLRVGDRLAVSDRGFVHVGTVAGIDLTSRAAYAIGGRISRVVLRDTHGDPLSAFGRRTADVLLDPEPLVLLAPLRDDAVAGSTLELAGRLPDLAVGRLLIVAGPRDGDGEPTAELATIAHVELPPGPAVTAVRLTAPLQHRYRRDAAIVRANVARASHGETVQEILGSGDPTQPLQRFALRQAPLTFVAGAGGLGRASTLVITIDGERWREIDSFEGAGPRDRVYTVALGEGGSAVVQFGDGVRGARLPAGSGNVRATYRKGLGLDGQLGEDRLTLLTTPTIGILGVTNPVPATGAAPPEDLADARRNAPLPVRTLGRVVSLQDYEDFARAFTGVAKAHAARFRHGTQPVVLVTIAGHGGVALPPGGATATALLASLRGAGDPFVIVRLHSYDPRGEPPPTFTIAGRVLAAPERDLANLRAAVGRALVARFGFAAGEFARPIHRSEIIATIQAVPGVIAVDLTGFGRSGEPLPPEPLSRITPRIASGFLASDSPTELLTLDPDLTKLEVTR